MCNPSASEYDPPKTFTFDTVFGPDSTQLDVYNLAARPIIDNVLEGYNGKIDFNFLKSFKYVRLTFRVSKIHCSGIIFEGLYQFTILLGISTLETSGKTMNILFSFPISKSSP